MANGGSIIRIGNRRESPFAQISRSLLQDERIRHDTRGLLGYLLSKPPDWKIYVSDLLSSSTQGRLAVRTMIKDAIKHGYMKRRKARDDNGKFRYDFVVCEEPNTEITNDDVLPEVGFDPRKPARGNPPAETDLHTYKRSSNKRSSNKRSSNINDDDGGVVPALMDLVKEGHERRSPRRDRTRAHEATRTSSPLLIFCERIAAKLPEWNGANSFLANCTEQELSACATWLHLWNLTTNHGNGYDLLETQRLAADCSLYRTQPFEGVTNPVGKIIEQSRRGNPAPLHPTHQKTLSKQLRLIQNEQQDQET